MVFTYGKPSLRDNTKRGSEVGDVGYSRFTALIFSCN